MGDMLAILFFIFGAIIASFVGLVVARLNTGSSILTGRSRCDAGGEVLEPLSLVPIVSYVLSCGRARCCSARVSVFAPLTELLLGMLFALSYTLFGITWSFFFFLLALALLLLLVLYDLAHQILPPAILFFFVLASLAFAQCNILSIGDFGFSLMIAGSLALFLALINLFSGGRMMGLSDAPLVFGLALLAGPLALSGFVFSFWIGAVVGIVLLLRRPAGSRIGVEVPFAPFLAAGFLLALFTGWNLFTLIGALP